MAKKPVETTEAPAKKERIAQNGVVRPTSGTKTGRVWEIADQLSQDTGAPATRAAVLEACSKEGINSATGATQYGRWCKFNNVPKPPRASKKDAAEDATADAADASEEGVEEEEDDFPEA